MSQAHRSGHPSLAEDQPDGGSTEDQSDFQSGLQPRAPGDPPSRPSASGTDQAQPASVEEDIAAALQTDLDHSDAVPLEEVPAVSLEVQVASALERAASSLPSLNPASCSLESFQSGASNMMEQLLIAMDGMQEALTATQESRLESERIAHAHTASLVDLKSPSSKQPVSGRLLLPKRVAAQGQLSEVAQKRQRLREELCQVNHQLEMQIESRLAKEAAARQAVVERKAVQVLVLKRDRELADRDRQMQELRKQLGKTRGSKGKALPPKPSTVEEQHEESPHSRGSSTWGASDDEELEERPKPQKQASPMRQPSSVFEDNQAKLKSKGAYGGPWLFGRTDSVPVPSKLELGSPRAPERDENLH